MLILDFLSLKTFKTKKKDNIRINAFGHEYGLVFPVHMSDKIFEDCMDLLLADEN